MAVNTRVKIIKNIHFSWLMNKGKMQGTDPKNPSPLERTYWGSKPRKAAQHCEGWPRPSASSHFPHPPCSWHWVAPQSRDSVSLWGAGTHPPGVSDNHREPVRKSLTLLAADWISRNHIPLPWRKLKVLVRVHMRDTEIDWGPRLTTWEHSWCGSSFWGLQ